MEHPSIPLLELRDRAGAPLGSLGAWQRKDMIFVLLHPGCEVCAKVRRALEPLPAPLRDQELQVSVVDPGEGEQQARFAGALLAAAQLPKGAAVAVVADRFLELFATLDLHQGGPKELVGELGAWAEAVARQCGECSRM